MVDLMAKKKQISALDKLNPRERIFVTEYAADGNASRAAEEAGYSFGGAAGAKLVKRPAIQAALKEVLQPILKKNELTVERLAEQLANYNFRSIKDFVDDKGYLITKVSDLPDLAAQCIESWEVEEIWEYNSEEHQREVVGQKVKVKLVSKAKMQELAMRYMKMVGAETVINQDNRQQTVNIGNVLWEQAQQPIENVVEAKLKELT